VRSLHPKEELLSTTYVIARDIADNAAPVSVALSRQMMWRMLAAPSPYDAHVADSRAIHVRGQMPDVREGITSFMEKRPPKFTDRVSADLPDVFGGTPPSWAADLK